MKTIEEKVRVIHNAIESGAYAAVSLHVQETINRMYDLIELVNVTINPTYQDFTDRHYQAVLRITETKPKTFNYISTFTCLHTGGNVWVDVFELDDRTTLAITPESITLYRGTIDEENDIFEAPVLGEVDISRHGGDMDLREYVTTDNLTFVTELTEVHEKFKNITTVGDMIRLYNDIAIHIFTDSIDIFDLTQGSIELSEVDSICRPAIEGNPKAGEDDQLDENAPSCPPPPPLTGDDSERYIRIYELFEELMKCLYDLSNEINGADSIDRVNAIIKQDYPFAQSFDDVTPEIIEWCQSCIKELHKQS